MDPIDGQIVEPKRVIKISRRSLVVAALLALVILIGFVFTAGSEGGMEESLSRLSYLVVLGATVVVGVSVITLILGILQYLNPSADDVRRTSGRKKMFYSIIALVVTAAVWGLIYFMGSLVGIEPGGGVNLPGVPAVLNNSVSSYGGNSYSKESSSYPNYGNGYTQDYGGYRPQSGTPDITDTREYMKTNYSAEIMTRDVQKVINDVKNIVKGSEGRVDILRSSKESGYISFVVPTSDFDNFRDQVEALTHRKLYIENISSQNMLGSKQSIENRTATAVTTLDSLNAQKAAFEQKHNQTVTAINAELGRIKSELAAVRNNLANISTSTSQAVISFWRDQEVTLVKQDSQQRQKLASENSMYAAQKQSLDNQIASQNSNLSSLNRQDTALLNNVETVNGNVSAEWVSLWQLAKIFSPIHPTWIIIILAVGLIWFLSRKNFLPKIELV